MPTKLKKPRSKELRGARPPSLLTTYTLSLLPFSFSLSPLSPSYSPFPPVYEQSARSCHAVSPRPSAAEYWSAFRGAGRRSPAPRQTEMHRRRTTPRAKKEKEREERERELGRAA